MTPIVKARTAQQKASADRYRNSLPTFPSAKENAPTSSWWTEAKSREEFRERAAQEHRRMALSAFGRSSVTAKDHEGAVAT
jgi:hypothetical protein